MKVFPHQRFYHVAIGLSIMLVLSFFVPVLFLLLRALTIGFLLAIAADGLLLFRSGRVDLERTLPDRFSNGDANPVNIRLVSRYPFKVGCEILDELPEQLQMRDFSIVLQLFPGMEQTKAYHLSPNERGEYWFGKTNTLVNSGLKLLMRKQTFGSEEMVKVYPSFLNIEKYELAAISQNLTMGGQKQMRRIGQSQEFDHIKEYVIGDDPRHINWSATARSANLMVNHYIDERSQPIYCAIDKGRAMKMPFKGMTLLDYSINASLILANVALKKGDRAGLITFQDKPDTLVPAQRKNLQVNLLLEALYNQKTQFNETDFGSLYSFCSNKLSQRSLLLMFTNFESIYSLERQLPFLRLLNRQHLLLVIFFKNSELEEMLLQPAEGARQVYDHTIAKQLLDEKITIRSKLHQSGIMSLYTKPENLKVDVINKYIEIKTKRLL